RQDLHFLVPWSGTSAPRNASAGPCAAERQQEARAPTRLPSDDELSSTADASAPVKRPGIEPSPGGRRPTSCIAADHPWPGAKTLDHWFAIGSRASQSSLER